jgi:hypothetical protein
VTKKVVRGVFVRFYCAPFSYGTFATFKTETISEASKQGQHTTTFAEMYVVFFDAKLSTRLKIKGFGW